MFVKKASRGFEPRSLDSESRVLTVTPRGRLENWYPKAPMRKLTPVGWDTPRIERGASRMLSGCASTTPCAPCTCAWRQPIATTTLSESTSWCCCTVSYKMLPQGHRCQLDGRNPLCAHDTELTPPREQNHSAKIFLRRTCGPNGHG